MIDAAPLPVHGVVLAGGKSSRMGQDKALISVQGSPMVQLAVERLRQFCMHVSISGNRSDLEAYAPVIHDCRTEAGPAAGLEACLHAARQPWALFTPVDVPLVGHELLRLWAEEVLRARPHKVQLSFLQVHGERQPAFCMLHTACLPALAAAVEQGERKLNVLFHRVASVLGQQSLLIQEADELAPVGDFCMAPMQSDFRNINTPQDLASLPSSNASEALNPPSTRSGRGGYV